jgi:NADH dehydrogenase [ubiquinone] 1 alpha subcomplex assembly factor 5
MKLHGVWLTVLRFLSTFVASHLNLYSKDIGRSFPLALDLGSGSGHIYKTLAPDAGLGGIEHLIQFESAGNMMNQIQISL